MRKAILFLIFILSASGLFAKPKVIFTKRTSVSFMELNQDKSIEGAEFCLYIEDYTTRDEVDVCYIICDNEDKIKKFLQYLLNHNIGGLYTPTIFAYEFIHEELTKSSEKVDIDSKHNLILNKYYFDLQ